MPIKTLTIMNKQPMNKRPGQIRKNRGFTLLEGRQQAIGHRLHLPQRQQQVAPHDPGLRCARNQTPGHGEKLLGLVLQQRQQMLDVAIVVGNQQANVVDAVIAARPSTLGNQIRQSEYVAAVDLEDACIGIGLTCSQLVA